VQDPADVVWADWLKPYLWHQIDGSRFVDLSAHARQVLKTLVQRRNVKDGRCFPAIPCIATGAGIKERAAEYALAELHAYKLLRTKRRPNQSALRDFACAFYVRAGLLAADHTCPECNLYASGSACGADPDPHPVRSKRDPSDPSRSHKNSNQGNRSRARPAPTLFSKTSEGKGTTEIDPAFAVFAEVFIREHAARYGSAADAGTMSAERRVVVAGWVEGVTAEACAWAAQRAITVDRAAVREELCGRAIRAWFDWPGTNGFLDAKGHPMGLIACVPKDEAREGNAGDLGREAIGGAALESWKRVQRRPVPPPVTPVETSSAPEIDASKPAAEKRATAPAATAVPPPPEFLAFVASMPGAAPARPLAIVEPPRPDPERIKLALAQIEATPEPAPAEAAMAPIAATAEPAPAEAAEEASTRRRRARTRTRLALITLLGAEPLEAPLEAPLDDTPADDAPPSAAHLCRRRTLARIALTYQRRRRGEPGT
jgi:hypothetical protein